MAVADSTLIFYVGNRFLRETGRTFIFVLMLISLFRNWLYFWFLVSHSTSRAFQLYILAIRLLPQTLRVLIKPARFLVNGPVAMGLLFKV